MSGKPGADREISVNTYTGGFTTMLNHHLRNRNLSLKAVGLLSKMLSLPPDWDYSIRGLATLNTDGVDGIRTAMKELEDEGYVIRVQSRDERGKMSHNKYTVYALPQKEKPSPDLPLPENPSTAKPSTDEPMTENPTQINTSICPTLTSETPLTSKNTGSTNWSSSQTKPLISMIWARSKRNKAPVMHCAWALPEAEQ